MESKSPSLYQLTSELKTIETILEETDSGELFERQNDLINLIQEKADSVVYYSQSQDDFLDAIDKRLKEIQELKKSVLKRQERLEQYVLACLDTLGVEKVTGNLATIAIKKPRQSVEVFDENLLPVEFLRTKTIIEPDKIALKKVLDENQEIQGARLKLGERSINFKLGK
jgi:hypothetical protein